MQQQGKQPIKRSCKMIKCPSYSKINNPAGRVNLAGLKQQSAYCPFTCIKPCLVLKLYRACAFNGQCQGNLSRQIIHRATCRLQSQNALSQASPICCWSKQWHCLCIFYYGAAGPTYLLFQLSFGRFQSLKRRIATQEYGLIYASSQLAFQYVSSYFTAQ